MAKSKVRIWSRTTNKWFKFLGAVIIAISGLVVNYTACHTSGLSHGTVAIEAYFTPQSPCMDLIVAKILSAKKLILVQAYLITAKQIVDALIKAHQNQVQVQLLVDKNAPTSKGSKINLMLNQGIPIIIDKTVGCAHNKVMIIDDEYVITGSFNWTNNAQSKNSENIVIITGKDNNRKFKDNWYSRAASGEPLKSTVGL